MPRSAVTADKPCPAAVRGDRYPDQTLRGEFPPPAPTSSLRQLLLLLQFRIRGGFSRLLSLGLGLWPTGKTGSGQEARKDRTEFRAGVGLSSQSWALASPL